ncbi:VOC family protein [Mycolicibacterium sp. S2-37]|uniref:VOC family protein n=1 Tax=Mycolicibacterium sp. S2-37 TaxID=2810297 RepID=UPI001A94E67B|nr:VOC family protein [Mycolicibacterium sp. S2-37]MBO0679376.1 VOC family protein [Mycolicibacterium sp. S2-37]
MTNDRRYPAGVPCWIDTEQDDVAAAREFYGSLFGWEFADAVPAGQPGTYLIATLDGRDVAAIGPAFGPAGAQWHTYVAVDDADIAASEVRSAGGHVPVEPADAGPGGRLAGCMDPSGARFRLWQPRRRLGAQLVNVPGSWNFSNLLSADPEGAAAFYTALFGWRFDDLGFATMIARPGYGDHLAATVDPGIRTRQSAIAAPPGFEDAIGWLEPIADGPDRWHVTFAVADRDESVSVAEGLGATVLSSDDSQWARATTVRDPQGAELTLSQFTPP